MHQTSAGRQAARDGDAVGLLLRSMYGFRTASANWQRDWQATHEQAGYKVGVANPTFFYNTEECRRVEFTETTLLWFARVEHWTGWARPHLANTPCANRTDRKSLSAEFKSFLLIMCIDALESTTNSRSSVLRFDAGRHQFSEGEKNAVLFFSFNFRTLLASLHAASRAHRSCHSVSS